MFPGFEHLFNIIKPCEWVSIHNFHWGFGIHYIFEPYISFFIHY